MSLFGQYKNRSKADNKRRKSGSYSMSTGKNSAYGRSRRRSSGRRSSDW